jgi:tetratricopeptide (TPR) repeat protein
MRHRLIDRASLSRSTQAVPPLVIVVVGVAACAVTVILALAGAPWWVVVCAGAGFAVGFVPVLAGQSLRRTRMVRGAPALVRSSHDHQYIVPRETPPPLPDFRGRDEELTELSDLLTSAQTERARTAVIVGAAGVGKTALAIQFAASYGEHFPGGQLFARLDHPSGQDTPVFTVAGRFLTALGVLGERLPDDLGGRLERYSALTANWRGLVILDDACHAVCVTPLLPSGPGSAAIVTSRREVEGLQAQRIELQPLTERDAVGLLQSVIGQERIESDPRSASSIARGGHPLSVRLAGAALANRPYLPLKQALGRMYEQPPLPQETSSAVRQGKLDLSYALLTNDERLVVRCLGLLAQSVVSPWELAALLEVDEVDAIRLADSLAQEQLVRRTSGGRAGVVRFEVHQHVLEYARARMLAETDESERNERLATLARARDNRRMRADELAWRLNVNIPAWKDEGLLDKAIDEARDALAIAEESGRTREVALALATLGDIHVELGNTHEALEMAQVARAIDDRQPPVRALRCLGKVMRRMRDLDQAKVYLAEAMKVAVQSDDGAERIRILIEQSAVLALVPDAARSVALADEAIALCEQYPEHAPLRTGARWARGNALLSGGQADRALALLDEAAGDASDDQALWRAWVLWLLAKAALESGRLVKAAESASEAIDRFAMMAHRFGIAHCKLVLGRVWLAGSRLDEATLLLTDALRTFQNCNDLWTEGDAKRILASAMLRDDRRSEAVRLLQDAARNFRDLGDEASLADVRNELNRARIRVLSSVDPERAPFGSQQDH